MDPVDADVNVIRFTHTPDPPKEYWTFPFTDCVEVLFIWMAPHSMPVPK
jgi:hypothetical protein